MSISQGLPSRSRFLLDNHTEIQEELYNVTKEGEKNSPDESFERSAALERVYVHEVYENLEDYNTSSTVRSKILQFLNNLEPGSIICDVGCGNGQYLKSFSPSIFFSIGVERSFRLAKCARNSCVEMALCDNLELPFRDESFDAVLSLSVIHHFATTERRISAIRELARILKVGGKIVISVWAFEQKSRRFDGNSSQDVLIPWQSPQIKNTITSDEEDEDDFLAPYHAYNFTEDSIHSNSNSSRSLGDGDSSSISSSSSPNDTCYSFVRRALQKLAGGKRSPWFLDSWTSRDMQKENSLEIRDEDAKDLPIELRKLDDYDYSAVGVKSRSLGSILNPPQKQIVRSLSSVPSLGEGSVIRYGENACDHPQKKNKEEDPTKTFCRPKLIKQKQSVTDDEEQINYFNDIKSNFLRKQSSLNEELMAESRIREKERIRKKIQKQVSLNESFLYRSLLTKRLQVIREGFTTNFKKSTGSLERLTKNGFVQIIKNIKTANSTSNSGSSYPLTTSSDSNEPVSPENKHLTELRDGKIISKNFKHEECLNKVRRPSESDSSKESSLQSDTSVESEDSFASVIHNPSLMPTSPLALSIQSPTKSHNFPKDVLNFSFDTENPLSLIKAFQGLEKNAIIETCESKLKLDDDDQKVIKKDEKSFSNSSISRSQTISSVKNLPEIPKFNRKISHFPIVKRLPSSSTGKNIIMPKLESLEIFNPEIDDSDSSGNDDDDDYEPSSPDSIDSVINKKNENTENKFILTKIEMGSKEIHDEFVQAGEFNVTHHQGPLEILNDQQSTECFSEEISDDSPPLSAKIQSHISNLSAASSQIPKHKFQHFQQQQKVNDFILEENEDTEDDEFTGKSNDVPYYQSSFKSFEPSQAENSSDTTFLLQESFEDSDSIKKPFLRNLKPNTNRMNSNESYNNSQENSNSTTASLDSPSIGGGSATHHVFHHIFRQNELDELINKHIGNLHIVSSFYEKQSWCVVCEKVQVWTI